ncbi:OsmC family protein [Ramlibacter sp.]|uniref:OsmC family protein n=1 Tax=Ramlibacter sp. TaxID=1917967 RepID=UPI002C7F1F58|nr:OsmC family protein [Ramlibacter sp.]HWI81126.1 OsmC family protein [Ramlibacter sp.]
MAESFQIELQQQGGYRFDVHFPGTDLPSLVTDEPPPLGTGVGPKPSQLLGTSVANCLCASLLFALRKFGNEPGPLRAVATVTLDRNAQNRMRISGIGVEIRLGVAGGMLQHGERAIAQFEEFCVVTQSVRSAIPVAVRVLDREGAVLKG